ncbi:MAG: hypothetical protein JSR59_12875 [Proteobacteria bacterium]|nr:hypothetical protein [Pseudomonadota bacterium]
MSQGHPQAYGVFKPVGHVVVAMPEGSDVEGADAAFRAAGLPVVERLSPAQMVVQADRDLAQASPLAGVGQELNLVKTHRALALAGATFLLVRTQDNDEAQRAGDIAQRYGASRAQHYSRWMVEELVPVGTTSHQVNESPDSGLDQQTHTGRPAVN